MPAIGSSSKVVIGERIRAALFNPTTEDHKQTTTPLLDLLVPELATCLIAEMKNPNKLTSLHLDSEGGRLSWGKTSAAKHEALKGREASNDNAESPFAFLTQQIESFTTLGIGNAAAMALARKNKDFYRNDIELAQRKVAAGEKARGDNGSFIQMTLAMRTSLLKLAIKMATDERKTEQKSLSAQREKKQQKAESLVKKRIEAATEAYVNKLHYREMYDSPSCCHTVKELRAELGKLSSENAKREMCKEQIRIRTLGLDRVEWHHPWSSGGVLFSADELAAHIEENMRADAAARRAVPDKPMIDVPRRKYLPVAGTLNPTALRTASKNTELEI